MRQSKYALMVLPFALGVSISLVPVAHAQTYTVLNNFTGSSGAHPYGGLMQDSAGTIYGTAHVAIQHKEKETRYWNWECSRL